MKAIRLSEYLDTNKQKDGATSDAMRRESKKSCKGRCNTLPSHAYYPNAKYRWRINVGCIRRSIGARNIAIHVKGGKVVETKSGVLLTTNIEVRRCVTSKVILG
jgi:hypothetical protein